MNRIVPVTAAIEKAVDQGTRETAFDLLAEAHENIQAQDAIDTGALLNSGYVETAKQSGRDAAVAKAKSEHQKGSQRDRRKKSRKKPKESGIEFAQPSSKPANHFAKVAFSVEYATAVEFGSFRAVTTYGHKAPLKVGRESTRIEDKQFGTAIPARPFLMPAAEKAKIWLPANVSKRIKGVAK